MSSSSGALRELTSMGFDPVLATLALHKQGGNVEAAVNWIYTAAGQEAAKRAERGEALARAASPPPAGPSSSSGGAAGAGAQGARKPAHQPKQRAHAAPAAQNHPLHALAPHQRIVHRAGAGHGNASHSSAYAASAAASASVAVPAAVAAAAVAPLPQGHVRGRVKVMFEHKGFGFLQPDDRLHPDVYFHWTDVWSVGNPLVRAAHCPDEPYLALGDYVSFSIYSKIVRDKDGGATVEKFSARDVRLIEYNSSKPVARRRTQAQVQAGENAPPLGAVAPSHAKQSAASASSAAACSSPAASGLSSLVAAERPAPPVPFADVTTLLGTRMCGIVTQLNHPDPSPHASNARRTPPHGFLALHHVSFRTLMFMVKNFTEYKHHGSSFEQERVRMRSMHVGDVLEFTLCRDSVVGLYADDIRPLPTLLFGDILAERRRHLAQEEAEEALGEQLVALSKKLRPLYISGYRLPQVEGKTLEFKSLTRHSSDRGRLMNLYDLADKYLNGFVNSSGGVLLLGVENDGEVVGLPLDSNERDRISTTISALLRESTPSIDPHMYTIRFIPVYQLYRSSWAEPSPDGEGCIGAAIAASSPSARCMVDDMLNAHPTDRVAELHPARFVVAVLIQRGADDVAWYQTKGRKTWVRSLGETTEMSIEQGVARKERLRNQGQAALQMQNMQLQAQLRELQLQQQQNKSRPEEIKRMVMEQMALMRAEEMAAAGAQPGAAAASAVPAAPAAAPAPAPISVSPSSSSFASASAPSPSPASASSFSSSSSSSSFSIPAPLLSALASMSFPSSAIQAALRALHSHPASARLFAEGAPVEAQVNAVVDELLTREQLQQEEELKQEREQQEEEEGEGEQEGEELPPLVPAQDVAAKPPAAAAAAAAPPSPASPPAFALIQRAPQPAPAPAPAEHPEPAAAAAAAASPAAAGDGDDCFPCEFCMQSVPFVQLQAHQERCLHEQEEKDRLFAESLQQAGPRGPRPQA